MHYLQLRPSRKEKNQFLLQQREFLINLNYFVLEANTGILLLRIMSKNAYHELGGKKKATLVPNFILCCVRDSTCCYFIQMFSPKKENKVGYSKEHNNKTYGFKKKSVILNEQYHSLACLQWVRDVCRLLKYEFILGQRGFSVFYVFLCKSLVGGKEKRVELCSGLCCLCIFGIVPSYCFIVYFG